MSWNDEELSAGRPRLSRRSPPRESSGIVAAIAVTAALMIGAVAVRAWWMQASGPGTVSQELPATGARQDAGSVSTSVANPSAQKPAVQDSADRTSAQRFIRTEVPDAGDAAAMARPQTAEETADLAYAAGRGAGELVRPLAQGYVDAAMGGFHEAAARQLADIRRQQIASIRVSGVMLTARGGHLIVDRDPGALEDSGPHLCRLAALVAPEPIAGKELIVSVGQPGRPQGVVGSLRC